MKPLTLPLALVLVGATVASAQSLGQLATKEAERRKAIQAPARVITAGDLTPVEPVASAAAAAPAPVAPAPPPSVNQPAEPKYLARDASYWLNRTIESERQRVRTELNLVKADIAATDKEILDFEDEARRSNVPPGWLRP